MRRGWRVAEVCDGTGVLGDALVINEGAVEWVGRQEDLGSGLDIEWANLPEAFITPGFVDAHVHLTATGVALQGVDLSTARSAAEILRAVHNAAQDLPQGSVVFGHGWDDSDWSLADLPSAIEVTAAAGGRTAYLSRVDVHSALVSADLLAAPRQSDSFGSALVRKDAHGHARQLAFESLSAHQRAQLQGVALVAAASQGITSVHENAGPVVSSLQDMRSALQCGASTSVPEVLAYWGALGQAAVAVTEGAVGAGGDLFVDGSIGSRTAHLCSPYADEDSTGAAYVSRDDMAMHIRECIAEGVQAGFHVIGDAAMEDICWALGEAAGSAKTLPSNSVRLEHAEMVSREHEVVLRRHGVALSMQPMFDGLWGGPEGMYARRLGSARAGGMNRIGDHIAGGLLVGFGSDSPVTNLGPWQAMAAAVHHHQRTQRIAGLAALAAHTVHAHALANVHAGVFAAGLPADFGVWQVVEAGERPSFATALAGVASGSQPVLVESYRQGNALVGANR